MTTITISDEVVARHRAAAAALPKGRLVIGGEDLFTASGGVYEHADPSTGEVIASVPMAGAKEAELAADAAAAAFPVWAAMPARERARLLFRLADLIEADKENLGLIDALEIGTPAVFTVARKAGNAADWFRHYAGYADKITGTVYQGEVADGSLTYSVPEPVGVVAAIAGWNFTFLSVAWKLAPALAAGCTVVIKATEFTSWSVIRFMELVAEAGFPSGVVNFVNGQKEPAQALITHPAIAKVSFTGGPSTARSIAQTLAGNLTPAVLELGGKSAYLVFADADLDAAVQSAIGFACANSGQVCASPSRVLVEDSIYDEFLARAKGFVEHLKIGDPLEPDTYMGPLGHAAHFDKVLGDIAQARQDQAGVLEWGGDPVEGSPGYFVQPAIFGDVDPTSRLATEEVFGPVISVFRFKTEEEAVELANSLPYGLSAYAWTNDVKRAIRLGNQLQAGAVNINKIQDVDPAVAFGGVGISGYGKEGGRIGLDEFVHYKAVSIAR
jgi:aldehyde dehydrogenase (NAD+)